MLRQLWDLLAPGGELVYVTCSILRQENDEVVLDLCKHHADAQLRDLSLPGAIQTRCGAQFLPDRDKDGLYYASLHKEG